MTESETYQVVLVRLNEAQIISTPDMNLRSKMNSLVRSIENLTAKKLRIEFEIKKQKRSLARKRKELKKSSAHLRVELESALPFLLESGESFTAKDAIASIDNYLFRESDQVLDD